MAKLTDIPRIVKTLLDKEFILEKAAEEIKKSIPVRTRIGKGVMENLGPTHQLPKLTESTVKIRSQLKKAGKLTGPQATPGKSGLNRSGELLNTLQVNVKPGLIEVKVAGDQVQKVEDVLKINKEYQFMRLSAAEFKRVLKAITTEINKVLSKIDITEL